MLLLVIIEETIHIPKKYELFKIITHRAKDFALSQRILIEELAGPMVKNLLLQKIIFQSFPFRKY